MTNEGAQAGLIAWPSPCVCSPGEVSRAAYGAIGEGWHYPTWKRLSAAYAATRPTCWRRRAGISRCESTRATHKSFLPHPGAKHVRSWG